MGATEQMTVKCYNYIQVVRMMGFDDPANISEYERWLELLFSNGVNVFSPPKSVGSGRARKQLLKYFKTNKWFDQYMREQNTWAVLKGKTPVKPVYRKCEEPLSWMLPWFD